MTEIIDDGETILELDYPINYEKEPDLEEVKRAITPLFGQSVQFIIDNISKL